jgi:hypothetical protein
MILSHHGKYEFGSPKLPMTPEALLLNTLDDLEAKMQTLRNSFAAAEEPPAHPPTDASAATAEDLPATASTPLEDPESPPVD